jgi:hypothetical protein
MAVMTINAFTTIKSTLLHILENKVILKQSALILVAKLNA